MKNLKKATKGTDFFYVYNSKGYINTAYGLIVFNTDNVQNGQYELKYFIEFNDFIPFINDNFDKNILDCLELYKKSSGDVFTKLSITDKEIKMLADNINNNEIREYLQLIHIDNDYYVSTNGRTMTIIQSRDSIDVNLFCNNITKYFYLDCKGISISANYVMIEHDNYTVYIKKQDCEFVPYTKVIPEKNNILITLPLKSDIEKQQKIQKMTDKKCTPSMIISNGDYSVKIQTAYLLQAVKLGIKDIICNKDNQKAVIGINNDIQFIISPMTIS